MLMLNRSLFFENRTLFFENRSMFLSLNRSLFFENRSLFLTFAPVSAHLKYQEISTKMADSQVRRLVQRES